MSGVVHIDIVTGATRGLLRDGEVLQQVLGGHWPTRIRVSRDRTSHALHHRLRLRLARRLVARHSLLLCSEILPTPWLGCASKLVLIPNQEWVRPEVERNLRHCDAVFCKTRYAERVFRERGYPTRFVGFAATDVKLPQVPKDYNRFLHVAGRSDLKGTAVILRVWRRNPHWPRLKVITSRPEFALGPASANVEIVLSQLSDAQMQQEFNAAGVHLCLSETEGFGHTLSEALSTEALVLVTDAPPMNELVDADCALLVPYGEVLPMSWSERFLVQDAALEAAVEQVLALDPQRRRQMGERGRARFLQTRAAFETALIREVQTLI